MAFPPSAQIERAYREYERIALQLLHARTALSALCLKHGETIDHARLLEAFNPEREALRENLAALDAGIGGGDWFDVRAECERLGVELPAGEARRYQALVNEAWERKEAETMAEPREAGCIHCGK